MGKVLHHRPSSWGIFVSMAYSDLLKDPRWQKKRLEIFQRDDFKCQGCGDRESTLNVHHQKYVGNPWECPDEFLITLCEDCHNHETYLKSIDLFELLQGHGITKWHLQIIIGRIKSRIIIDTRNGESIEDIRVRISEDIIPTLELMEEANRG